ncbi:MAG TPA: hypothetical protein PKI11_15305 [Candidatus Hydrogenedentes bacterium]|nr:hypothetical protein [Candidatus Hydrogenedentota bacterium]HNT89810.1 hypothetical protein [Candidatus Hydrogenedentota bacterium]
MRKHSRILLIIAVVGLALVHIGCETYGQSAGLGALVGGGAGAIIGHQSGHALEGAAIGAALGAATGLIVHDVKARRARTAEETAQQYNYQPSQGLKLQIERSEVLPNFVARGNEVESQVQYALLGSGGGVEVTEKRTLLRGGQVVSELSSESFVRSDGTWVSSQRFRLPNDLQPGEYAVMQRVSTAQHVVSGTAPFTVQ